MRIPFLAFFATLTATSTFGQLATYSFGTGASPTGSPTQSANGFVASVLSASAGVNLSFTTSTPASSSVGGSGAGIASGNGFNQSNPTNYFTFSLTPHAGQKLTISAIGFNSIRTSTGPTNWSLDYLISDTNVSDLIGNGTNLSDSWSNQAVSSVTLSGITSTIEFRLFGYNASGSSGAFRIDDLVISGSVSPIPEPASFTILAALGTLAFSATRRRSRIV